MQVQVMRELEHHLLNNTKHNIGIISLEENQADHLPRMSVEASKRLYIRYETVDEQQLRMRQQQAGRALAFDHFGSIQTDEILSRASTWSRH